MRIKPEGTYNPSREPVQYTRCRFCGEEIGLDGIWNCDCVGKINWRLCWGGGDHVGRKGM